MSEDLDALLGDGFMEELKREEASSRKNELAKPEIPVEDLKKHIISNSTDIVDKANEALTIALQDLQATPGDPLTMKGVSDLIGAFTGLLN